MRWRVFWGVQALVLLGFGVFAILDNATVAAGIFGVGVALCLFNTVTWES